MCLYVKEGCKPEIAKEDIVCWKIVCKYNDYKNRWCGPFYGGIYKQRYNRILNAKGINVLRRGNITHLEPIGDASGEQRINEGFHAIVDTTSEVRVRIQEKFTTLQPAADYPFRKAIIPKGAEYCLGNSFDIVGTHIIVFRDELSYKMYCRFRELIRLWNALIGKTPLIVQNKV